MRRSSLVDQRQLPCAQLTSTRDGVVDVGERDVQGCAADDVLGAIRENDLAAALKRDAVLDELEISFVTRRV